MFSEAPSTLNAPPTKPPNRKLHSDKGRGLLTMDKPGKCKAQFISDPFHFKISCFSAVMTSSKQMNADENTGDANSALSPVLLPLEGPDRQLPASPTTSFSVFYINVVLLQVHMGRE